MGANLWAALCLVLVIEGLMLFAAPRAWKRAVVGLLRVPDRSLRIGGGIAVAIGLACLYLVR